MAGTGRHIISSSDGITLQFQDSLMYKEFKREEMLLHLKYYKGFESYTGSGQAIRINLFRTDLISIGLIRNIWKTY